MSVEGTVFATAAFPTEGSNLEKFMKEFTAATGAAPTSNEYEAVGRDNIYAFAEAAKNANYDLSPDALIEGFKHSAIPKLEVFRPSVGHPPLHPGDPDIVAVASDSPVRTSLPVLDLNDYDAIAAFVAGHLGLAGTSHRSDPSR